jgi:hypothetical protein
MRKAILSAAVAALCLPFGPALAQDKSNVNPEEIIRKFAAKEAEFREARNNYTYRQTVKMEELDAGGNPTGGKWDEIDDIIFTPEGKRMEKVVWAPVVHLDHITLTSEDVQDLRDVQPFVLTTSEIGQYSVNYLGPEKVDDIGCYSFSVKPKKMEKGKRYFEGQIWVDDRDLQIVKTYGKGVGIVSKNNQFPKFETYREQIDGKYWFPTYTHADDTLHFPDGSNQRIRMKVLYQDYKRFEGRSTITYGKTVDDTTAPPKKKQ